MNPWDWNNNWEISELSSHVQLAHTLRAGAEPASSVSQCRTEVQHDYEINIRIHHYQLQSPRETREKILQLRTANIQKKTNKKKPAETMNEHSAFCCCCWCVFTPKYLRCIHECVSMNVSTCSQEYRLWSVEEFCTSGLESVRGKRGERGEDRGHLSVGLSAPPRVYPRG